MAPVVADLHLKDVDALFSLGSTPDLKNSDLMIGDAAQGGMGLPSKDYYLKDTPDMKRMQRRVQDVPDGGIEGRRLERSRCEKGDG